MELRKYQQEIVSASLEALKVRSAKILVKSPTGSGKSVMSLEIIKPFIEANESILVVAPQLELTKQLEATYSSIAEVNVIHGKNGLDTSKPINVTTLQTLHRRDLLDYKPSLIVLDEAHFGFSGKMLQDVFETFSDCKYLMMSATPFDTRGKLLVGFSEVIDLYSTTDLINDGYLVPVKAYAPVAPNLKGITVRSGEFVNSELDEKFNKSEIIDDIVKKTLPLIGDKQTVVYAINISHAENLAKSYAASGISAKAVSSNTPRDERDHLINEFKNGSIQMLTNVAILTTGVDIPQISCIVLAGATRSQNKYHQIVGRGLRTANDKDSCTVLDCASTIKDLGYPTSEIFEMNKKKATKAKVLCTHCNSSKVSLKSATVVNGETHLKYDCRACNRSFETIELNPSSACEECNHVQEHPSITVKRVNNTYEFTRTCENCSNATIYRIIEITDKVLAEITEPQKKLINSRKGELLRAFILRLNVLQSEGLEYGEYCSRIADASNHVPITVNGAYEYLTIDNVDEVCSKAPSYQSTLDKLLLHGVSPKGMESIIAGTASVEMYARYGEISYLSKTNDGKNKVYKHFSSKMIKFELYHIKKDMSALHAGGYPTAKVIQYAVTNLDKVSDAIAAKYGTNKRTSMQRAYMRLLAPFLPSFAGSFNPVTALRDLGFKLNTNSYTLLEV